MTDAPQTTSLLPNEWQALCHGGAAQLAHLFANNGTLDDAAYQAASEHMARLSMFMRAWRASSPPAFDPPTRQMTAAEKAEMAPPTGLVAKHAGLQPGHLHPPANGADPEPPKRKGWPKGKPRGPRKPAEAVQ